MAYYGNSHDNYAANGRLLDEPEEYDPDEYCPVCGGYMEWVNCHALCDDGEFDLYEMNPNEYEPGETQRCTACGGEGGYLECANLPHTDAQIAARLLQSQGKGEQEQEQEQGEEAQA